MGKVCPMCKREQPKLAYKEAGGKVNAKKKKGKAVQTRAAEKYTTAVGLAVGVAAMALVAVAMIVAFVRRWGTKRKSMVRSDRQWLLKDAARLAPELV